MFTVGDVFVPSPPKRRKKSSILSYSLNYTKFDFTVDEGKEWLNPSREKNKGTHRRKKGDEKSSLVLILENYPLAYFVHTSIHSFGGKSIRQ